MTCTRLWAAHALIAIVGLGSLGSIVTGRDAWPFLSYPMYAELVRGKRELHWLYGEADGRETPLHGARYWHPADEQRLGAGLARLAEEPQGDAKVRAVLSKLAQRYQQGRRTGRHEGAELDVLRVYTVRWDVRSRRPTPRAPDERTLIGEVSVDAAH